MPRHLSLPSFQSPGGSFPLNVMLFLHGPEAPFPVRPLPLPVRPLCLMGFDSGKLPQATEIGGYFYDFWLLGES